MSSSRAGVAGRPDATLSIAIVLALLLLDALERVKPAETIELAKTLLRRIGIGDGRRVAKLCGEEPSTFDDDGSPTPERTGRIYLIATIVKRRRQPPR